MDDITINELRSNLHCAGVAYGLYNPEATPGTIGLRAFDEYRDHRVRNAAVPGWVYVVFTQGFEEGKRQAARGTAA